MRYLTLIGTAAAILLGGIYFFKSRGHHELPSSQATVAENSAVIFNRKFNEALGQLKSEDLKVGSGLQAENGQKLKVHYTGWLMTGKKFDSSLDRKDPLIFVLGTSQVMPGLDNGIKGMKIGGKRRLTIPSFLAFGDKSVGDLIPAGSTLIYEVELLGFANEQIQPQVKARASFDHFKKRAPASLAAKSKVKARKSSKKLRGRESA